MRRRTLLLAALAWTLLGQSFAHGQRQTERFIPIGQSPGASGRTTRIGTVESVEAGARAFTLAAPDGRFTVQVPDGVPVWLDRSRGRRSALAGGLEDLRPGRRAEVGYENAGRSGRPAWVKVEVAD